MKNRWLILMTIAVFASCSNPQEHTSKKGDLAKKREEVSNDGQNLKLPFVGKRSFETRPGVSGTGTPQRYIEIEMNGDVYFSFEQENQADGTVTKERYFAGKDAQQMKCIFSKLDGEKRYYTVSKDSIYEVDENNKQLKNEDCCGLSDEGKAECECKGELSNED